MKTLNQITLDKLAWAFREIENQIQPPIKVESANSFVFKFENKGGREAIVQKLARVVTGLQSTEHLLNAGFLQEVGVLYRTLDELLEDIAFLATSITENCFTEKHQKYLDAFYSDPVTTSDDVNSGLPKPNMPPRKKIRAETFRAVGTSFVESDVLVASESVSTVFSGYVHAASESIMETYGGNPPRFQINGMNNTPRKKEFNRQQINFMYKGIMAYLIASKAFGNSEVFTELMELLNEYESNYENIP